MLSLKGILIVFSFLKYFCHFITREDSLDWKEYGVDHEIKTVVQHKQLSNGSIILFHNDAKYTPEALRPILDALKEKGYEIVPISELIIRDDYYMDHTGKQIKKQ